MISLIKQTSSLADIYPDTSSELCNKHVKLLSSLKNTFGQIYDEMEPEKYVIVNGIAKVLDLGCDLQLSFALENGVTVLMKKTYENEDIYINGNHIEEEVIFNSNGKHTEGIHEKVDEIKDIIRTIRTRSTKNKPFFGAILYIHSNIGQNLFSFQECFMLGVAIALLIVHEEYQRINKSDIMEILQEADGSLSLKVISNILDQYEINKCTVQCSKISSSPLHDIDANLNQAISDKSIGTHESNQSIKCNSQNTSLKSVSQKGLIHMNSATTGSNNSIASLQETNLIVKEEKSIVKVDLETSYKLILCRLDLSHEQLSAYESKVKRIKEMSDCLQLKKQEVLEGTILQSDQHLLKYIQENKIFLADFLAGKLSFSNYLNQKHDLDLRFNLFDEQVVELVNQIKLQSKFMKDFCIIQGTVLLISLQKQYYAEIMCFLRKLLNEYKMSTHHFLQTRHQFDEDKFNAEIGEIMFTSSASSGCVIYTSTEDAWL